MGMFDYITVPKTYFQDILSRNQRRMIQSQVFQTKDLENCLLDYKIFKSFPNDSGHSFLEASNKKREENISEFYKTSGCTFTPFYTCRGCRDLCKQIC